MIRVTPNKSKIVMRFLLTFGIFGIALYPIVISPMIDSTYFNDLQKIGREGIDQDKIQPGNLKVWSDPFDRKK